MSRVGEMLFRHQTHTKALVVLKCRAVAVVAPRQCARVDMLNVQGLRYAEDNDCCRLADIGASVEVITH